MLNTDSVTKLSELDAPLLTAYLNMQPSELSRHRLTSQISNWVRRKGKALVEEVSPKVRSAVREQLARIDGFLAERKPDEDALLILAGPDVWKAIPLPGPVENELTWGKPSLTQLYMGVNGTESDCIVVLDRKGVRFFDYNGHEMKQMFDQSFVIDSSQWKKKGSYVTAEKAETTRGSQRDAYERRIDAQYRRFLRQLAKKCTALCSVRNNSMLFIVGEPRFTKAIEKPLEASFPERVRWIRHDAGRLSLPRLRALLKKEIDEFRESYDAELIDEVLRYGQHATLGIDETLAQLQKGRIRSLLLSDLLSGVIRECAECGQFDRSADPICSVCHRERRSVDLRQAIMELAQSHDTKVRVISGKASERLNEVGGLAGWLRDRTQSELR
jgi:hypothetical protein